MGPYLELRPPCAFGERFVLGSPQMTQDVHYFKKKIRNLTRNWTTDPKDPTTAWIPNVVTVTRLNYMTVLEFKFLGTFASDAESLIGACAMAEQMLETVS